MSICNKHQLTSIHIVIYSLRFSVVLFWMSVCLLIIFISSLHQFTVDLRFESRCELHHGHSKKRIQQRHQLHAEKLQKMEDKRRAFEAQFLGEQFLTFFLI